MKIEFNSDDNLLRNEILELYNMEIIIWSFLRGQQILPECFLRSMSKLQITNVSERIDGNNCINNNTSILFVITCAFLR